MKNLKLKILILTMTVFCLCEANSAEEFTKTIFVLHPEDTPYKHAVVTSNEKACIFFHMGADPSFFWGDKLRLYSYKNEKTSLQWTDSSLLRTPYITFFNEDNIVLYSVYPDVQKRLLEKRIFSDFVLLSSETIEDDCIRITMESDSRSKRHFLMWVGAESDVKSLIYQLNDVQEVVFSAEKLAYRSDIALDKDDNPHVAFDHHRGKSIYYATRQANGEWITELVNDGSIQGGDSKIIIDKEKTPVIAYEAYLPGKSAQQTYLAVKRGTHWQKTPISDGWSDLFAFEYIQESDMLLTIFTSSKNLFLSILKDNMLHTLKIDEVGDLLNENISLYKEEDAISVFYVNRNSNQFIRARMDYDRLSRILAAGNGKPFK